MPFRKGLIWIKRQHTNNKTRLFLVSGLAALVLGLVGVVIDIFLPWNQVAIFLRALFALPLGVALFVFVYSIVISRVEFRKENLEPGEEYLTLRERLSPSMRVRLSFIIGAVLFVLMFAVTESPAYTFMAASIMASVLGIFTFTRKTSQELRREAIGLPDSRDALYEAHMRERARSVTQTKRSKERETQRAKELDDELKSEEKLEK